MPFQDVLIPAGLVVMIWYSHSGSLGSIPDQGSCVTCSIVEVLDLKGYI